MVAPSQLSHRAFLTNSYSGNLQVVDTANDTTAYYSATGTTTISSLNNGQYGYAAAAVFVPVGGSSATFEALSPDGTTTLVYDQHLAAIYFVSNSNETETSSVSLPDWAAMALWSPDSSKVYAPVGNRQIANSPPGAIQVIDVANSYITTSYQVPSVRWIALSPNGNTMLAFADNSDSMWLIDLSVATPTVTQYPGFARPVTAFFSSDNNTAYVLNCGPQCGSTSGPSVAQFDIPSKTIKATVPVGGASAGLLSGSTLYVAGYPGGNNGTLDAIDVSTHDPHNRQLHLDQRRISVGDGAEQQQALHRSQYLR